MCKKITKAIKDRVAIIIHEITSQSINEVIPESSKRESLYLMYEELLTNGRNSPHTASAKLKQFIFNYEKAKVAIKAMHLMKYEEPIEILIPQAEKRSELYNFYINNGVKKTIEVYYKFL